MDSYYVASMFVSVAALFIASLTYWNPVVVGLRGFKGLDSELRSKLQAFLTGFINGFAASIDPSSLKLTPEEIQELHDMLTVDTDIAAKDIVEKIRNDLIRRPMGNPKPLK